MVEPVQAQCAGRALRRAAALVVILALLASPAATGPRTARAAPAAQAQNLCTLVPPGYDPAIVTDMADYCYVVYNQDDGSMLNLELSRWYSPVEAYRHMPCDPNACISAAACNSLYCQSVDSGDVAPAGFGHTYRGISYAPTSLGGWAYAWTRGCYLLVGSTLWTTPEAQAGLGALMEKTDGLIASGACAGCNDPSVCAGTGGGASFGCGPGVAMPEGSFATVGYGCQYEAASDGVTCQAAVQNACPDAALRYTWSLDGSAVSGYEKDVFNPTGLGLCAGTHTVSVSAEDTVNNRKATGMSWTFTSTQGSPCGGGAGASLSLTAPSCSYLATEDRVMCITQVMNAPDGADIVYEWTWDGRVQKGAESMLDIIVSPDGREHTVRVTARDRVSGQTSASASATVQAAAGNGNLQIQTESGTLTLGGKTLTRAEQLVFAPNGAAAKLLAECPLLGLVVLLDLKYDATTDQIDSGSTPAIAVIASLLIECGKLKAEAPLEVASVGDPALYLPARAAPEDLPVQLQIEVLSGPLRVTAVSDQVLLDVQTSAASVRSVGQNDFGVAFDPQTGETKVFVTSGSVEVRSMSSGLSLATLNAGDQATIPPDSATIPPDGESQVTTPAPIAGPSRRGLAVVGCPAGLAALAGLVLWVLIRSRKKRAAAPTAAAPVAAAPAPRQVTPVAASGPRLVVKAGKASAAAADLSRGPVTIGRHPSNTLVLSDALVSDRHAQVSLQNRFWVLTDLGSGSGTFLNGVRIQRQALRPNDRIQVGQTVIEFQAGP